MNTTVLFTLMILSFWSDRSGQTVQTQTRLLRSRSTLFAIQPATFGCITPWLMPPCSNFRVITADVSGVCILRSFTVFWKNTS